MSTPSSLFGVRSVRVLTSEGSMGSAQTLPARSSMLAPKAEARMCEGRFIGMRPTTDQQGGWAEQVQVQVLRVQELAK